MRRPAALITACAGAVSLMLAAAGCGGSSSANPPAASTQPAQAATQALAATPATARVTILSPHAGADTGSTLTVRVTVGGEPTGDGLRLRYVLDHGPSRAATTRFTLSGLALGRHSLEVLALAPRAAQAHTTFTVRPRLPATVPAAAPAPAVTTAEPPPAEPPVTPARTQPTHTTTTPARTPTTSTPTTNSPPAGGGIPQGGGGDGDGDNSGGPSDGDGNV